MGRIHNEEFKREAVRIGLTSGLKRRQVAADLKVGHSTLAKMDPAVATRRSAAEGRCRSGQRE